MKEVYRQIDRLTSYASKKLCLDGRDADYVRNYIFDLLNIGGAEYSLSEEVVDESPENLLKNFYEECEAEGLFSADERTYYGDAVMGALSLSPSAVQDKFAEITDEKDGAAAMDWFYGYSVCNDYVKKSELAKNIRFEADGLIITINKSKPEFRDPKKAVAGNSVSGGYPKCSICRKNEGFFGRNKRNLRTVGIELGGEDWFWQFSPYGYLDKHGVAVNCEHTPMKIDRGTFVKLLDFTDKFSGYFIGCNAPLPRIGGSVLAHDHFQAGAEILPLHVAPALERFVAADYPDAVVEIPDWDGTVVRVVSHNKTDIIELSERIRKAWEVYTDKAAGIIPSDGEGIHNAISPTVVKTDRGYEMNVILRSNITSEEFPDGVFHAHPEFHAIKKESIGLIEAQGLFILPGRLDGQLNAVAEAVSYGRELPEELSEFGMVYNEIKAICGNDVSKNNVEKAVKAELGSVCRRILRNTAVMDEKTTAEFLYGLGFTDERKN